MSWISTPIGYDEHPPAPSFLGEWFTDQVLQTLVSNPEVWSRTVLFHMYDENDGFFDHVAPPVAPPGTPGEYLSVRPLPPDADGIAGPIGLGFRVPLLVISPFSRGGRICSQTFDHTSQLRFIEERFDVAAPQPLVVASLHRGRPDVHAADGSQGAHAAAVASDKRRRGLYGLQGLHAGGPPRGGDRSAGVPAAQGAADAHPGAVETLAR